MLEIKNLTKVYRSKTGDEVKALDNVSISFPETGMVFILGKSGSGKSTLLNVMGGLDAYDDGEFIIKGKSSKDFAGSDFDAYRNTFIGFIFQEYNVLDDFTVGANIGLALELQGKKATNEKINEILEKVDLSSYAKRKPNELSGGQKQRVAIARALVKDPQIIMADEPTGALDSNTGKQIFDTLKELSREKLVLIVSHDRDFAERYADRIVELSDGKILSDVTKHERHSVQISEGIQQINERILRIKGGYRLTEADLQMINDYLQQNQSDIILSGDTRINDELRSAAGISAEGHTTVFEDTAQADLSLKSYEKTDSRFIRSTLPIKNALRMGVSGLKHKKFRLVMTILLSLIAFALFGFADTLGAYEKETAAVSSVMDSEVNYASVRLGVKHTYLQEGEEPRSYYSYAPMNDEDIQYLRDETGLDFVPVFTGGDEWDGGFSVSSHFKSYSNNNVYTGKLSGLVAMKEDQIASANLRMLSGRLPEKAGEIAITELMLRQFNEYGFVNAYNTSEEIVAGSVTPEMLIGKHITLSSSYGYMGGTPTTYEIVGIVDTDFQYDRYQSLLPTDETDRPSAENTNALATMVLTNEVTSELNYGFHALGFAHEDDIALLAENYEKNSGNFAQYMSGYETETFIVLSPSDTANEEAMDMAMSNIRFHQLAGNDAMKKFDIVWLTDDKNPLTSLGENQVIVSYQVYQSLIPSEITKSLEPDAFADAVNAAAGGTDVWTPTASHATYYSERLGYLDEPCRKAAAKYVAELMGLPWNDSESSRFYINSFLDMLNNTSDEDPTVKLDRYIFEKQLLLKDFRQNNLLSSTNFLALYLPQSGISQTDWDSYSPAAKENTLLSFYQDYLQREGYTANPYGSVTGESLRQQSQDEYYAFTTHDLGTISFRRVEQSYGSDAESTIEEYELEIVGYFLSDQFHELLISEAILNDYQEWYMEQAEQYGLSYQEIVAEHENGSWGFAIAPMEDEDALRKLIQLTYDEESDLNFSLQNSVMETLDSFNEFIEIGSLIFLYVGIGFAVFSALLLMSFISTSISYKKREIGILRAVGAKSSDVFKIFFSEALVIALLNFILSLATVIGAVTFANTYMRSQGINITLLTFGVRQVVLMLLISIVVALVASFLPVYNIAKRKPIDAIKDR